MENSKRSEATLIVRMRHGDDYGMNEDSNLSHSVRASNKEHSQRTATLTDNENERLLNTVLRDSIVSHLHQRVCHKVGDTMVRTSRFTLLKIFLAYNPSSPSGNSPVGHNSSS